MCWVGEVGGALYAAWESLYVVIFSLYSAWKKESSLLWMPLFYFAVMQILEAFTYSVIDQCDNRANQVVTLLSYMHIAFQPLFINMFSIYFIPKVVRKKVQYPAYFLCLVFGFSMLLGIYQFKWADSCNESVFYSICGTNLCSTYGNWNIAWSVPYKNVLSVDHHIFYWVMSIGLPFLYGSYRFVILHLFMGVFLSIVFTDNPNEQMSVYCLLTIGYLLLASKTSIRNFLYVRKWPFYPKNT